MESALEEIEFLALSPNRVEALTYLTETAHTRRELVELTGASQPTLGRILHDFEDRGWIEREDGAYRATVTGTLVSRGFSELVEILDTDLELRPIVRWLPAEAISFDLEHLTEATITKPSRVRPNAPVKRVLDLLGTATDVRVVSYAFNEQSLELISERTASGDQEFDGVFSSTAIDALADDSQLRDQLRDLLTAENATIRISEESIPVAMTITDSTVHLFLRDDNGILQASLDVDEPEVYSWATELFERYWNDATPLTIDRL
ncbi:helix-turn-helix transcriptional regulator [Haloferax larsenii]|uniref:Predicted transcriptional regulator, contains HTH domain n=1 Tax=Haloferax larsenii TaxID=302484 RepID=A0A1H7T881_HALLR|nr:transcriptional regulator FilR1 domain-containing protein [Haloferax larsenii]SEL81102.1 Predicted transcriptional regulator, contains HTH domain [Haloferax larsenii]